SLHSLARSRLLPTYTLFPYTTLFRSHRVGAAERAAAGIGPERYGDVAGEPGRDVAEGIERADLHGRADLAARNRGARWRPEYELRRGTGGDSERGARRRAQAGRRRGQPVTATRLVEGQVAEARHPADGRDRRHPGRG